MIIDCHSHIWPNRSGLGRAEGFSCLAPPESDQADAEQHKIASSPADVILVLGFVSNMLNAEIPNDFIRDYVATAPNRLIGFAGIDPVGPKKPAEELVRLHRQDNFAGVAISPACQGFHPCHTKAMSLYQAAADAGLPVYFLCGDTLPDSAMLEYACPTALDEVARSFPELKIVISHLGFPWVEQTIALLAKHPNIFADIAGLTDKQWQAYRTLTLAHEYGVIDKLFFASDFPNHTVKSAAESLYNLNKISLEAVLPAVPREQLRGIVERDSLALLNLKTTEPQP